MPDEVFEIKNGKIKINPNKVGLADEELILGGGIRNMLNPLNLISEIDQKIYLVNLSIS